ncbi:MAG: ABC transporter substrate-binding protein, partial [Actinomycetota bacterium]
PTHTHDITPLEKEMEMTTTMTMRRALLVALVLALTALGAACGGGSSGGGGDDGGGGGSGGGATEAVEPDSGASYLEGGFPAPETPVKGGVMTMAMAENIDCWSGLSYYGVSWSVFYFMARGLYGYPDSVDPASTGQMQPDLAADMPTMSEDGLTYTVTLREGLTFPDGSAVDAEDVKATYEYMLDPNIQCGTGGPPASGYYAGLKGYADWNTAMEESKGKENIGIAGIKVVDDLTVSFELEAPDGSFPRALAMGWAYIRPSDTPHTITDVSPPFVGPYRIKEYTPDKLLVIEREPTWADNVAAGVPETPEQNNLDGIELEIGVPADIQLAKLKSNELDLSFGGDAPFGSDVPAIANDPAYKDRFFSTADAAVSYGTFRTDQPPFDTVEARQAVNYAIDREALLKIAGGKLVRSVWNQILPPNLIGDQPTDLYPYDPAKATELVTAAGVTGAEVLLLHGTEPPGPEAAASIKENLEAVGFTVKLKGLSEDVYYGYLADPESKWNLAPAGWIQDYPDAITFYLPLLMCESGSNYGKWCDEAFDAKVNEINAMPPGPERDAQFAALSTSTMTDQAPWYPTGAPRQVSLISERLGNYIWGPAKNYYFGAYFLREG